jgi:3'-phosphoadenosine 5'-phosphosulfate sulfotransferase (PAPS reductase)/FAD synthetase
MNLSQYDRILVAFSGGKDSIACFLHLLEIGVDMRKLEIHHHDIDGMSMESFMDWPCTPSYCDAFAKAFDVRIYHSWRHGGFKREMLRDNQLTAPVSFELPEGGLGRAGGVRGKLNTRRKFPQVSANLQQRWCSSSLKIDVMDMLINNQERFTRGKTLVITGERAQESAARANYNIFEPHRTDNRDGKRVKRHVDHWRPVHAWPEEKVWEIIERHKILVHPAYRLGWGRLSCMTCIFGSPSQWASVKAIDPERFEKMAILEQEFECTIHRTKTLTERIQGAKPYVDMDPLLIAQSLDDGYAAPIFVDNWKLPAGAFGESAGPT